LHTLNKSKFNFTEVTVAFYCFAPFELMTPGICCIRFMVCQLR